MEPKPESPTPPALWRRPWIATVAGGALFLACSLIPLPGASELLGGVGAAEGYQGLLGWLGVRPPLVSVVGGSLVWLALVRGVVALLLGPESSAPRAKQLQLGALGIYFVAAGWQAWAIVRYLAAVAAPTAGVADGPGLLHWVALWATLLGGSAVLWLLGTWLTQQGLCYGPLALLGLDSLLRAANELFILGQQLATGAAELSELGPKAATLAPLALVAGALGLWWPAAWPVRLARLRPPLRLLDVLAAPAALSFIVGVVAAGLGAALTLVGLGSWVTAPQLAAVLRWLGPLLPAALAAALFWAWRQQASPTARRPRWLALGVGAMASAGALVLAGFGAAGGLTSRQEGWADAGASFEVVLEPAGTGSPQDAATIARRCEARGVQAEIVSAAAHRIVLRLHGTATPESLLAQVLGAGRLTVHLVERDQSSVRPQPGETPPPGLLVTEERDGRVFVGPTPGSLLELLDRPRPDGRTMALVECRPSLEQRSWSEPQPRPDDLAPPTAQEGASRPSPTRPRVPGAPQECLVRIVAELPVLEADHLVAAQVETGSDPRRPALRLQLSPEGTQRLAQVTVANVGARLAFVLDGRILAAPVIQDAIVEGSALVTLGSLPSESTAETELQSLLAGLASGRLVGRWSIARLVPLGDRSASPGGGS